MSTDYTVHRDSEGVELVLLEQSGKVTYMLCGASWLDNEPVILFAEELDEKDLRAAIIRQIEVLSYISADPEEVLKRFNVDYGDKQ